MCTWYSANKKDSSIFKIKKKKFQNYIIALSNNQNFILPRVDKNFSSAYHLFPIQIKKLKYMHKQKMFNFFKKHGFQLQVHYKPIFLQEYYKKV